MRALLILLGETEPGVVFTRGTCADSDMESKINKPPWLIFSRFQLELRFIYVNVSMWAVSVRDSYRAAGSQGITPKAYPYPGAAYCYKYLREERERV